jgi:hypothetical protein
LEIAAQPSFTVIFWIAVFPFSVFAVIVADPLPTALTVPFVTVATFRSDEVQVMPFCVVLEGVNDTDNFFVSPIFFNVTADVPMLMDVC